MPTSSIERTSLKNVKAVVKAIMTKPDVATQGRKYGYAFQNEPLNTFGKRSWGRESDPPINGLRREGQAWVTET
jgi:hypothetical protein